MNSGCHDTTRLEGTKRCFNYRGDGAIAIGAPPSTNRGIWARRPYSERRERQTRLICGAFALLGISTTLSHTVHRKVESNLAEIVPVNMMARGMAFIQTAHHITAWHKLRTIFKVVIYKGWSTSADIE